MVGASKILTVSYGTFSCTLEGFDEPFNTMKAIAEYFRDLAAEDRYFGAEPPQPDAEMLHRIAEREMARRVEAKIQKNGVILRPSEGEEGLPPPEPAAVASVAAAPAAPVRPEGTAHVMALPPAVLPVEAASPAPIDPVSDPISESVAAKLQRIRSAVAQARAAQNPAEPDPEIEPAPIASEPVATSEPPTVEATPVAMVPEDFAAPEDFGFALDISGPLSPEETAAIVSEVAETEDEDEDEPAAEGPETQAVIDPEKAERMRRRAERRAARLLQLEAEAKAIQAPVAPEAEQSAAEPVASEEPAEATLEQVMAALAQPDPTPEELPAEASPAAEAPQPVEPSRPVIRARVIKLRRSDAAPVMAPAAVIAANDTTVAHDATEVEAPQADPSAEVMAAVSATLAETVEPPPPQAASEAAQPGLSPEAEAELLAELAALTENLPDTDWDIEGWSGVAPMPDAVAPEALPEVQDTHTAQDTSEEPGPVDAFETEVIPPEPEPEPEPEVTTADAPEAPLPMPEPLVDPIPVAPRPAARVAALPEGDLPRLLEKADAQMAGNENRRRISAIAHLKAAVAATVAERRAGGEDAEKDETAPYRQDLTQAVRPRRPVMPSVGESHHLTAARPEVRPAPLVLVSEQRVDRAPAEAVAKAQAVRPRRITSANLAQDEDSLAPEDEADMPLSPEEASSFAEFAQSRSPQGLAELLEAAAAYTAQIEGRPHFSPPQIMSKVSAIGTESFSREDRLRVFGTLLRQGKIAKVKRGQYAITEASRFYQGHSEAQKVRR